MSGIFISHTPEDKDIAEKLEDVFQKHHVPVSRNSESVYSGESWTKDIANRISGKHIFLLLWSKNASLSYSVQFEWKAAHNQKKNDCTGTFGHN